MKVVEIKTKLDELGIKYIPNASKDVLLALLPAGVLDAANAVAPVAPVAPLVIYKLLAKFKGMGAVGTEEEGTKVIFKYESEGATLAEALEKLEFPARITALVKVIVTVGNKTVERAFAPHKWNYILENKDARELGRLLGV